MSGDIDKEDGKAVGEAGERMTNVSEDDGEKALHSFTATSEDEDGNLIQVCHTTAPCGREDINKHREADPEQESCRRLWRPG
jgi:hypothetical protein